jgi:hypothetical protein
MIEAYAFLAVFVVQILILSVLHPAWLARYVRAKAQVQLPGWEPKSREGFLNLYRMVNVAIGVPGLVLLAWVFNHMRPDWDTDPVTKLLGLYGTVQIAPIVLISMIGAWYKRKTLTYTPTGAKRTASLERRGLFKIVSPFTVFLAVLAYFLFAAFIVAIQQHPVPGFAGYFVLGTVTLVYALNAFCVYWMLYRRKRWPLETRTYRMQAVEVQVKIIFYTSFAIVVFVSCSVMLRLLHLSRWMPFAMSAYFVIVFLFTSMVLFALRRQAEADRLDFVRITSQ